MRLLRIVVHVWWIMTRRQQCCTRVEVQVQLSQVENRIARLSEGEVSWVFQRTPRCSVLICQSGLRDKSLVRILCHL